jgi:hypothetical protein
MNGEEAQVRHLFAAATEDMPPGIDLLDGLAAARRRDRSRRARRGAVLLAGIVVAAASVTAVTLTTGSAPPALATVTSALTRTLTQSYHLGEQDSYYSIVNGQIRNPHHDVCTTEADAVRHLLASSCSGLNASNVREVGGYTYYGAGNHWLRIPTASVKSLPAGSVVNGFTAAAPQQMLAELKQAAKVTAAGPASGPGWTGTRYAFSGNFRNQIALSGTVTVDQQGRTRALVLTTRGLGANALVMTQVLTFSDFGAPLTVTPPPADHTSPSP